VQRGKVWEHTHQLGCHVCALILFWGQIRVRQNALDGSQLGLTTWEAQLFVSTGRVQ